MNAHTLFNYGYVAVNKENQTEHLMGKSLLWLSIILCLTNFCSLRKNLKYFFTFLSTFSCSTSLRSKSKVDHQSTYSISMNYINCVNICITIKKFCQSEFICVNDGGQAPMLKLSFFDVNLSLWTSLTIFRALYKHLKPFEPKMGLIKRGWDHEIRKCCPIC